MTPDTDSDLLRQFVEHEADAAFAGLVERHVNLVYSVAHRQTGDAHQAEEITQAVFLILAKKAGTLRHEPALSSWLFQATRLTANNFLRGESRRRAREQEAYMQSTLNEPADEAWPRIAPLLDRAVETLGEADRRAILLRFYEGRNLRDVGAALGASEDAAKKRVNRAVEKLRKFFTKRGVVLPATTLTAALAANSVQAAPAGLAAAVSAIALAGTAVTTSTLIAATTKTIVMTTFQKIAVTAALTATIGAGVYEAKQAHDARNAVAKLQAEQTPLAMENARLQAEANKLSDLLAGAKDQKQLTQAQFNELLKLRGQIGVKQANSEVENDPAFQKSKIWLAKEKKIREQFALHPEQKIPEMQFLTEEDWLDHARHADVDTEKGMRIALSNIRAAASGAFATKFGLALQAYLAANQQQLPATASQLAGYFNPPLQDADAIFSRYVPAASDSFVSMNPNMTNMLFVQDKSTVVDAIDQRVMFGQHETVWLPPLQPSQMNSVLPSDLEAVAKAYSDANGQGFLSPYDLKPYATTPEQKAALDKLILSLNPTR
ncbi:MAG: sigma-70 family RNA polymerase sigma factor [Verrucomicrobiae bacterium]|nr:sigma-70 family RNA polymerase sigma factor [Verrucomicrobiae bacterium]